MRMPASMESDHIWARVGTVEITVMWRSRSHGPRSSPDLTIERGAGTRQEPWAQASHISSQEASNATDSPANTRSPGPRGASCRKMRDSASTNAAALRCDTATPLGRPVVPDVKMIQQSSVSTGPRRRRASTSRPGVVRRIPSAVNTAATSAWPNTSSARSAGSSTSTGTYAAPAASVDRIDRYRSTVPDGMRMPTRSPAPTPCSCIHRAEVWISRHTSA